MKLYLLRHAKSEPYSDSGMDIDRDLLPIGIKQCSVMSEFLNNISKIDIYCSTAKRARRTFDNVLVKNNYLSIHFHEKLYLAELEDLIEFISELKTVNDILIIGHNNGMSDLLNFLIDSDKDLKTCEYTELELDITSWNSIKTAKAKVITSFHPKIN